MKKIFMQVMVLILISASGALAATLPKSFDADGDGKADFGVWRTQTGYWYVLRSADSGVTAAQWGSQALGDIPVPGDYDGDGTSDVAVWRPDTGVWYVRSSSVPGSYTETRWGTTSDIPTAGDFDGDGKDDIAVWRPSSGTWYALPSGSPGRPASTIPWPGGSWTGRRFSWRVSWPARWPC